jgi:hypothetical protein
MDLIELLQREIHDLKMQWSKLKEENVVLKGFKAMVMQEPKKYHKPGPGHNGPPDDGEEQDNPTVFDVARDDFKKELNWKEKYDKEHKLRLEAEGETHLVKAVGMNSPEMKAANLKLEEMRKELDRVKLENNNLFTRVADSLEVNESHQRLNGKLQVRIAELEEDNQKLAGQVGDQVERARKAGL